MAITRWNPTRDIERAWSDFDRMFNRLTNRDWFQDSDLETTNVGTWNPSVDILDREHEYVVTAEIPGMKEDDVHISLKDNVLTLKGEKKSEVKDESDNRYYRERVYGNFQRMFRLDAEVDPDNVRAEYDNGILTIHLPKSKETMAKQIPIKSKK